MNPEGTQVFLACPFKNTRQTGIADFYLLVLPRQFPKVGKVGFLVFIAFFQGDNLFSDTLVCGVDRLPRERFRE
jgi:hypothetical protein